jgi:hypothetical protein
MISVSGNQYAMWAVNSSDSRTQGIRREHQRALGMVIFVPSRHLHNRGAWAEKLLMRQLPMLVA